MSLAEISEEMAPNTRRGMIVEAIETLRRRSLVERGDQGATFHAPIHGSRQSLRNA